MLRSDTIETGEVGTYFADVGYQEVLIILGVAGPASGHNPFSAAHVHSAQAITCAQLAQHAANVVFHRLLGEAQLICDFLVA